MFTRLSVLKQVKHGWPQGNNNTENHDRQEGGV